MSNPRPRKKARRAVAVCAEVAAPLYPLTSLPLAALEHLLPFLPVASLQLLGATCTFLHQLIHGPTITTLEFPFAPSFLQELAAAATIDKKPLLRLAWQPRKLLGSQVSTWAACQWARKVEQISEIQLPMLDLSQLRELVLVPDFRLHTFPQGESLALTQILTSLAGLDKLRTVTRLEAPLDSILSSIQLDLMHEAREMRVVAMLAGLIHLHMVVRTKAELNQLGQGPGFWPSVGLMAHVKTVSLAITVMPSVPITRKTVVEVASPWVEELVLHSPCLLQLRLRMALLKRVTTSSPPGEACTLLDATDPQPFLHRSGSCGVDVRSLWEGCPLVTTFNGVTLEVQGVLSAWHEGSWLVTRNHLGRSYKEWMVGTKRAFHRDYWASWRVGELGLQAWARTRWSPRQIKLKAGLNYWPV